MTTITKEQGAVSLFIVLFTTLLVSIITVGFIRIMLSDQRQATAADLSSSAYDSAQSGIEDAKRALLDYQSECASGDAARCANALALINSQVCNKGLTRVINYIPGQEVLVQQTAGDKALQQAYTCVKIDRQTDDYVGALTQDESKLIHLAGVSGFDSVRLEWFSTKDLQGASTTVNLPSVSATPPLLSQSKWTTVASPNRPSLMRTQLMQFGDKFTLSDFEDVNASGQSNANTLFLYPTTSTDKTPRAFTNNARKVASAGPTQIHCEPNIAAGKYSCSVDLTLPTPIDGGNRTAYLRLTSLYKKANYRVTLFSAGLPVKFDGVQPKIDSTGRANDLFRRVESRVEVIDTDFPYPDMAVDTTGNFCKAFIITDDPTDYQNPCTP